MSALRAKNSNSWDIDSLAAYVAEIVAKESGNILGENQRSMVKNRLQKRLISLGNLSPQEYIGHLNKNYQAEAIHLISLLTTHHTFFFREFCHFEYLLNNLASIVDRVKKRGNFKIQILSAACSQGQEVYSLAMFFNLNLKKYPGVSYEIIGTDIDPKSIKIGNNGVYQYNEIKSIPQIYLKDNWQRGTGDISRFVKVRQHLKDKCSFQTMNLLHPEDVIRGRKFDIVFCRNVFIYFAPEDITKIVSGFRKYVHQGGIFITGLSESLKSIDVEKQILGPSIYGFDQATPEATGSTPTLVPKPTEQPLIPRPIRILAVDDSSSILKILTKVFSSDPDFELVGTATNGLEAQEFLKKNTVDAMTLDLHMPEMDGIQYLKKNFRRGRHPHVVVVSSASRENTHHAQEALRSGASDFVEKPALNNISERADEIKNKIKMTFLNSDPKISRVDKSFSNKFLIRDPESKARFFVASYSDRKKVELTLKELKGEHTPIFIFFEGNTGFLEVLKNELSNLGNTKIYEKGNTLRKGQIHLCDFKRDFQELGERYQWARVSLSVFGIMSKSLRARLHDTKVGQVLLEDTGSVDSQVRDVTTDIFPWTSFAPIGTEFLANVE